MITEKAAEAALHDLIETEDALKRLTEQSLKKELMLKHIHALLMKQSNEGSVSAQERDAYASERYKEAVTEVAVATAELVGLKARRKDNENTISLYQSMVKDRQGPRP